MLGNYFRELLEKYNRVIIPDFGAFLVKDTGDVRDIANTTFSPFLRYNDGLIENFLSEKEDLTKADATVKVKEYVDHLKSQLEKGEKVYLPQLGYFSLDSRGTIQFLLDTSGKEPKEPPLPSKPVETAVAEKLPEPEKQPPTAEKAVAEEKEPAAPKKAVPKPVSAKRQTKVVEEKAVVATGDTDTSQVEVKETSTLSENKEEKELPKKDTQEIKSMPPKSNASKQKTTSNKSGKNWLLLVFSLIVLLAIAVWQYDNLVNLFSPSDATTPAIDNTQAMAADTAHKDTTAVTPPTSTANASNPAQPTYVKPVIDSPDNKFFVVVGSFTNKANAEAMKAKLASEGYQPIIMQRSNGLNSVVISGHKTKDEAKLSLESYKKKNGQGWIMAR